MQLRPGVDRDSGEYLEHVGTVIRQLSDRIYKRSLRRDRIYLIGTLECLEWGALQWERSPIRGDLIEGTQREMTLEWIAAGQALDTGDPWVEGVYDALHWMLRTDGDKHRAFLDQAALQTIRPAEVCPDPVPRP